MRCVNLQGTDKAIRPKDEKNKNKESSQAVPYKPTNISRINNNK